MRTRIQLTTMLAGAALMVAAAACENPAKNKPKAKVGEAVAETGGAAATETLALSDTNGKIEFVGSKVTGSHTGGFKAWTGRIELAGADPTASKVHIDIDMNSTFTDTERLTGHLKSKDFFEVETYPTATFTSTQIVPGGPKGATHTITGNLDLHGVKKSITFPATIEIGRDSITARAEFAINRRDWKIVYDGMQDDLIRDDVVLRFDFSVPRKPAT